MRFVYGKQDFRDGIRGQESCWLLTNGLGGFSSQNIIGGASRNDHAVLMACTKAPNHRWNVVHRLEEVLEMGAQQVHLSSQQFSDGTEEEGWKHLSSMEVERTPSWLFHISGITVEKQLAMVWEKNTVAVCYEIRNDSDEECSMTVIPWMQFVPKGNDLSIEQTFQFADNTVESSGLSLHIHTNGNVKALQVQYKTLYYAYDCCDGRRATGLVAANHEICFTIPAGERKTFQIVFSLDTHTASAQMIVHEARERLQMLAEKSGFHDPVARQLAVSADAFITQRGQTKTILAGYPFFEDWGRDTMIALPGCTLATGRYDDAKRILMTFMQHEQNGLMPNLFPEGENQPLYNTVDAALLFINCVWLYYEKTSDTAFLQDVWSTMERIILGYRKGTAFGIHMDTDGLIAAGQGFDQVTWMDVRIGDILPTPRHGKPVEINAYWYNALCILEQLAPRIGADGSAYGTLAQQVRESFLKKFWMEQEGYLRDLVSGTAADEQIRCNQIWAVSMPFTMLSIEQGKRVVQTVARYLYTPVGLRTLSPEDVQFHASYGGEQKERDLAYHQGTVWPFPLGAYYLAYLKVNGQEARSQVKRQLAALIPALREGCAGQLPEIYDGQTPTASRGCFAQAWSVGELLRVYEVLEQ